jgi:hypothetical protein
MNLFKIGAFSIGLLASLNCHAQPVDERCETTPPLTTKHGTISKTDCGTAKKGYLDTIKVDDVPVLSDTQLYRKDRDDNKIKWVFSSGKPNLTTGCPDRVYLIDLSIKPVKVIAFGVKKACNEFQWASWGEKRSVIALKNNVKFIYENGKMTLPASGEKLWKSIEPPHAGAGLSQEDAVAFAEDVPPSK